MWMAARGQGVLREGGLGERAHSLKFPEREIRRKSRREASCQLHGAVQRDAVFLLVC